RASSFSTSRDWATDTPSAEGVSRRMEQPAEANRARASKTPAIPRTPAADARPPRAEASFRPEDMTDAIDVIGLDVDEEVLGRMGFVANLDVHGPGLSRQPQGRRRHAGQAAIHEDLAPGGHAHIDHGLPG